MENVLPSRQDIFGGSRLFVSGRFQVYQSGNGSKTATNGSGLGFHGTSWKSCQELTKYGCNINCGGGWCKCSSAWIRCTPFCSCHYVIWMNIQYNSPEIFKKANNCKLPPVVILIKMLIESKKGYTITIIFQNKASDCTKMFYYESGMKRYRDWFSIRKCSE